MPLFLSLWVLWGLLFPLPTWADNTLDQGLQALNGNNLPLAVERFTTAIAQFPALAYSNRCLAHLRLEAYAQAESDCRKALALLPENPEVLLNLGLSYYYQGDFLSAMAYFTQGIQRQGSDYRFYYNRALAQAALGNSLSALSDYNGALQFAPSSDQSLAPIYTDRGVERMILGEYTLAIEDFDRAIDRDHRYDRAFFNRGCAHQHQGNLQAALDDFDRFIASNLQNPDGYKARAIVQQQLGNLQGAVADLDSAAAQYLASGKWDEYAVVQLLLRQWLPDRVA